MDGPHVIKVSLVPYDVDPRWSDGCGGSDWWPDDFGANIRFAGVDDGSAYVCPEKTDGDWRLYRNASGSAWRLSGLSPKRPKAYRLERADDRFREVVACGEAMELQLFPQTMKAGDREGARTDSATAAFDGSEVLLEKSNGTAWKLFFRDGGVEIVSSGFLGIEDEGFIIDQAGFVSVWATPCDGDAFWNMTTCEANAKERFRTFGLTPYQIDLAKRLLHRGAEGTTKESRDLIGVAELALEQAIDQTMAVQNLEATCRTSAASHH